MSTGDTTAHPPAIAARIREEALFGRLPLLPGEREYGTRGILATGFTYAVAAWCFLIGGYAANVVGAIQGIVTLVAGSIIGVTLSSVASALACNRYGLEQIDFTKSCFGQKGAKLVLVFYVVNQIGWTGMILVMFGRGVANVSGAFGLPSGAWGAWVVRIAVLAGIAVAYAIVVRGVHVLNVFNAIVTPGLLIITVLLFWVILQNGGWSGLAALAPLEPARDAGGALDPALGYVMAFESGLGAGFSWWPGIGFLTRNTDTQRNSLYPQIATMGLGMGVVCCTGLLAGLLFRSYDPTVWMLKAGGPFLGAAALLLVGIANVSASAIMMYTATLALRHVRALRGMVWRRLAALAFVPTLAYAAWPEALYENGNAFLTYNATMFAPISGILLVDYLLLRRQVLNVSQIFEDDPRGDYWFQGGFNAAALAAMLLGQGLYVWLLNPVSLAAHGPVRVLTASGPSVVLPMVVYYAAARLVLIPRGSGGYRGDAAPRPILRPNI